MKRSLYAIALVMVLVSASIFALPTTATVQPAGDLQMIAGGSEGFVMSLCGYRETANGRCKVFPNFCCK